MIPILYDKFETEFKTNGIGRLSDSVSCVVTEERNGTFELTLTYPVGGKYFAELQEFRIIYTSYDITGNPEPFDIYSISKPMMGNITVKARHIHYRLGKYVITPSVIFFKSGEPAAYTVMNGLNANIVGDCPFSFTSDIVNSRYTDSLSFSTGELPCIVKDLFGDDSENTLRNEFGGELKYDNFTVSLLENRGEDNGVKIRRGKNMAGLTVTTDSQDLITEVLPYWYGTDEDTNEDCYVDLAYDQPDLSVTERNKLLTVKAANAGNYGRQLTLPIDFSNVFDKKPTVAELREAAEVYLQNNLANVESSANYAVNLMKVKTDMRQLYDVKLCDVVTVEDDVLGIRVRLQVCKTTWDSILEEYTSVEIGKLKTKLTAALKYASTLDAAEAEVSNVKTSATSKINSSLYNKSPAKLALNNATKISALEKKLNTNSGGGGNSGEIGAGKIGGTNNCYGTISQYNSSNGLQLVADKDGLHGHVVIRPDDSTHDIHNLDKTYFIVGEDDDVNTAITVSKPEAGDVGSGSMSLGGGLIKTNNFTRNGVQYRTVNINSNVSIEGDILIGDGKNNGIYVSEYNNATEIHNATFKDAPKIIASDTDNLFTVYVYAGEGTDDNEGKDMYKVYGIGIDPSSNNLCANYWYQLPM